jgi:phage tail-like protein
MDVEDYPPPAFHFSVKFTDQGGGMASDMAFQSVDGLERGFETEALSEGGDNWAVYSLPKPGKPSPLKLKRGLVVADSDIVGWCRDVLEGGFTQEIETVRIEISLLDETGAPIATWYADDAYPVKWTIGGFDAMKNEIAIETLEMAFTELRRDLS